jgi:hypothetical protein
MRPGVPSEQRTVSATGQRLTLRLGVREEGCPAALPWLQEAVPKMSLLNVHSPQPQPYIYRAGPPESQLRGTMDGQGSKGHVGAGEPGKGPVASSTEVQSTTLQREVFGLSLSQRMSPANTCAQYPRARTLEPQSLSARCPQEALSREALPTCLRPSLVSGL